MYSATEMVKGSLLISLVISQFSSSVIVVGVNVVLANDLQVSRASTAALMAQDSNVVLSAK